MSVDRRLYRFINALYPSLDTSLHFSLNSGAAPAYRATIRFCLFARFLFTPVIHESTLLLSSPLPKL